MQNSISLLELTKRKSGALLFHYPEVRNQLVVADWSECPAGTLPMVFLGRTTVSMPRTWHCINKRRVGCVWDFIPEEKTEVALDERDLLDDLEYSSGCLYELVTGDNSRVTVIVPDGWE